MMNCHVEAEVRDVVLHKPFTGAELSQKFAQEMEWIDHYPEGPWFNIRGPPVEVSLGKTRISNDGFARRTMCD